MEDEAKKISKILAPAVILCEPQLGENIGTSARAMANFGISDLRIVNPRDGWPNRKALAAASQASQVVKAAKIYENLESAVADLRYVYATTARNREVPKPVCGPGLAAENMMALGKQGIGTGLLFGRERWGLNNEEIALADEIVTLPVDPNFSSLNIAQAVLLLAYEWRIKAMGNILPFSAPDVPQSTKEELIQLFEHLEFALTEVNYFRPPEKRPIMERNLRAIFTQAKLNEQQVRTMRGVIAALQGRKTRKRKAE